MRTPRSALELLDPSASQGTPTGAAAGGVRVPPITVLTQNMYPGANLDQVIAALTTPGPSDDDNLDDMPARFDEHIDCIVERGFGMGRGGLQGRIALSGDQPSERIAGPAHPLWASDHAGLTATLNQMPVSR